MKKILLAVLVGCISQNIWAQITSCAQTLRLAQSTYEQGRLHELPILLKPCLTKGEFTKEQRVRALTLLTLANIYLEEPAQADSTMLQLLNTDPYFAPNKDVDPAEFIALYHTFRTREIYRLGVKFGVNSTQPNVSSYNPISDGTAKYASKIGIVGGITLEVPLSDKFTLVGEVLYQQKSFTNTSTSGNKALGIATYSNSLSTESQSWISVPLMAQYYLFPNKNHPKIIPYVVGGISTDLLLSASIQAEQKRTGNQAIDVKTFSITSQRQKINLSGILGLGAKTRIAGGYIFADLKYSYGFTRVNSLSGLFDNQHLLFDYKIVDGIFNLNSYYFNVGYVQNFFNPKKLKRKR